MKTNYFLASLAVLSLILASCEADDTADIIINDNSTVINNEGGGNTADITEIGGTKTADFTLETGEE